MLLRNWMEIIAAILLFIAGLIIKIVSGRKCKELDGFKGINNTGAGNGWKMK